MVPVADAKGKMPNVMLCHAMRCKCRRGTRTIRCVYSIELGNRFIIYATIFRKASLYLKRPNACTISSPFNPGHLYRSCSASMARIQRGTSTAAQCIYRSEAFRAKHVSPIITAKASVFL